MTETGDGFPKISTWERMPPKGVSYFEHQFALLKQLNKLETKNWKCGFKAFAVLSVLPGFRPLAENSAQLIELGPYCGVALPGQTIELTRDFNVPEMEMVSQ